MNSTNDNQREDYEMVKAVGPDYIAVKMAKLRKLENCLNRAATALGEARMLYEDIVQLDFFTPNAAAKKEPANGISKVNQRTVKPESQPVRGKAKQLQQVAPADKPKDKPVNPVPIIGTRTDVTY